MTSLTIREAAQQFGCTARTLRFYEDKGLLASTRSASAGQGGHCRIYSPAAIDRLHTIRHWKAMGFTLDEIGELLSMEPAERARVWPARLDALEAVQADVREKAQNALDLIAAERAPRKERAA